MAISITIVILVGVVKYNPVKPEPLEINDSQSNIVSSTTYSAAQSYNSLVIIPGERIYEITANTNRKQLTQLFPPNTANLEEVGVQLGEGMTTVGTRVEINNENKFTIVWKNEQKNQLDRVVDFSSACNFPEGIHVNTTLKNLQENLGNFQLFGFRWDYGGTLQLKDTPLEKYQDYLIIRLAPPLGAMSSKTEALNAVSGERLIESKNQNLNQLDLRVSEIIMIFKE